MAEKMKKMRQRAEPLPNIQIRSLKIQKLTSDSCQIQSIPIPNPFSAELELQQYQELHCVTFFLYCHHLTLSFSCFRSSSINNEIFCYPIKSFHWASIYILVDTILLCTVCTGNMNHAYDSIRRRMSPENLNDFSVSSRQWSFSSLVQTCSTIEILKHTINYKMTSAKHAMWRTNKMNPYISNFV